MNSKRTNWVMIGLVVVLSLVAIATVYFGNTTIKNSSTSLNDLKLEHVVQQRQEAELIKAQKDIEQYQDFKEIARAIVPQDKDQARAVREIVAIARESGIAIQSISFPSSSLGASSKAAPQANQNPDAPGAKDQSSSSQKAPPVTQAEPVEGVSGVYSLEMSIVPEKDGAGPISYTKFLGFLERLEKNRRTAQVTQIRISPVSDNNASPFIDFSLTINIFVKP